MSATRDPADSLQAKITAFLETLEPAERDLFTAIVARALDPDVEGFATPAAPRPIPIPYPLNPVAASSVTQVLNGIGNALNTSARKG